LRADFKNLGVIDFVNHEVEPMFGYHPDQLIGKNISVIMPEAVGEVHRKLMLRFFDKGESRVINKFSELFVKDKDGYFVPIIIYIKVLPNLETGLKFIGAIKRTNTLSFSPAIPSEISKLQEEYIICDKDNYIQYFTSGLTIELGLFPKMFTRTSASGVLYGKEIKIDDLSLDFSNRENEILASDGAALTISTKNALPIKIERECLSNE
jgi:PAS domain S-box-containing protein